LNSEIIWSPDSKAFAVTGSEGGANGQYQTAVFYASEAGIQKVSLTLLIERAFGHPVKCGWSESPNVAAIKWANGSSQLIVAAEIISHSNCDSFGTFKAYQIDVPAMRVVRIYNQIQAKELFGADLGVELAQSEDNCIRKPSSCYVSTNHSHN
jgi:hypothetical protein